jgi:electron transport complex protein RnfD
MSKLLSLALSPHEKGKESVSRLMYDVLIALLPAFIVAIFFYGLGAIIISLTAVISAIVFEYLITRYILKKPSTVMDGSAALTGLLIAFNVPSNLNPFLVVLGSFIAIAVAKMSFGGIGNNIFNPALVARVFLLISFPVQMTSWPVPIENRMKYLDAITGPTALGQLKEGVMNGQNVPAIISQMPSQMDMFLGQMTGSLGEVSALALIIGLIYMLIRGVISWHIPITIFTTVFLMQGGLWLANPGAFADPVFHLISGGLMLGAIFMATDYVTSPMNKKAMVYYALGIGVLTVVIRNFGAYPEGVSFAILIMNAVVPILNRYVKPKRFGEIIKNGK